MSQKGGKFQSKSKKFGGGGQRGFGGRKKDGKSGYSKKSDGDRGGFAGKRDSRPAAKRDGGFGAKRDGGFGGKREGGFAPKREGGFGAKRGGDSRSRDDRPRKPFDGEKKSFGRDRDRSFGDKKFGGKKFSDGGGRSFRDRDEGFRDRKPPRDRDEGFRDRKPPRGRDEGFRDRKPSRGFDRRGKDEGFRPRKERSPSRATYQPASAETKARLKSDRINLGAPSSAFLYGLHAVRAALQNPARTMQRLIVTESGLENIRAAYDSAVADGIRVPQPVIVDKLDIERLLPRDAVHQEVLLDCQPPEEVFLQDILIAADDNAKVVVLDQVTDPHNVGAILRSAAAFGARAVIVQKLHAPDMTGTLAKAASGAAEIVPIVRETNLSRALEQLKEAGFTCIGLDERGRQTVAEAAPRGRVALVMGAEGDGLRRLVAENCDVLARLPTSGPIASLNVSNAAAVALYELVR